MAQPIAIPSVRIQSRVMSRVRAFLHGRPGLLKFVRFLRCSWFLGPIRPIMIRVHQRLTRNPALATVGPTLFEGIEPAPMAASLRRSGYATGLKLPEAQVQRIVEFSKTLSGNYHVNPHERSEEIRRVIFDAGIVSVIRQYIGAEPLFVSSHLWWSIPKQGEPVAETARPHGQRWHFDAPDYRSLVVFFYLTDVDEDSGAHAVIENTHLRKTPGQLFEYYMSDAKARETFGDRIRVITGPAGTGFFEEQTIFHKQGVLRKPRLMLGFTFALQRKAITERV